jgi:hypothetical protein
MSPDSGRTVMWKHLWNPSGMGLEHLVERERAVDSVIVWTDDGGEACRLAYQLEWDDHGRTRRLFAQLATENGTRLLDLRGDGEGHWRIGGRKVSALDGCLDVDLWPTPFTNSLPIRRLSLDWDESADIRVAHVIAPELDVSAKAQRYTSHGGGAYRFETLDDGFSADLTVDENGLVLRYPELFERLL